MLDFLHTIASALSVQWDVQSMKFPIHQNPTHELALHGEQVYGLCIMEDGCPGIVTEYLPGSLLNLIEQCPRDPSLIASRKGPGSAVPYPVICSVGLQLVETLQFLHKQQVCLLCTV
jgi:hypothetical protein